MDKHQLQARIEAINAEMVQLKANYAKLEGHLGECTHWLQETLKAELKAAGEAQGASQETQGENSNGEADNK